MVEAHCGKTWSLRVSGLTKHYGRRPALEDVAFSIHGAEVLGLIGPNGAGKTTLFECLAGVLPPTAGVLLQDERVVDARTPGRNGASPHPDLFPAANPVLQPPVKGRIGLWSKTDSTSEFKDYVVGSK
jgi:energy-coupling factor transporter ATP-binding protein EcfA2